MPSHHPRGAKDRMIGHNLKGYKPSKHSRNTGKPRKKLRLDMASLTR